MPEKQRIEVRIMNREFALLSTESAEYVRWLAGMVDQRMRQVALNADFGVDRVAVLAALNLADELYKLQEQAAKDREELRELRRALEKAGQAAAAAPGSGQNPPQAGAPVRPEGQNSGGGKGGGNYNNGRSKPRK